MKPLNHPTDFVAENDFRSLVDAIRHQAIVRPEQVALIFLPDGEAEVGRLTYAELDRRARAFAARLQAKGLDGHAILLMLPSSIYYVVAFLGSLYAKAVPVPVYPPTSSMHAERVAQIVKDCDARGVILGTASSVDKIKGKLGQFFSDGLKCDFLPIDETEVAGEEDWIEPALNPDCLAFLQYTSGSTSQPRGVQVTHANLLAYCRSWQATTGQDHRDIYVSWLPLFHDMGLIGSIIQPLYMGATVVLMPPMAFLQKPLCWLTAFSRYRGTTAFAPNFAYELCAATLDEGLRKTLDLSSWRIAANGAEPVHADTLHRFTQRFAASGFRAEAMHPCYGLAEATLTVSLSGRVAAPHMIEVEVDALKRDKIVPVCDGLSQSRALVSCGRPLSDVKVQIVNAATSHPCAEDEIGEIWLQGTTIANGYWQRPEETRATFQAYLANGDGPFLRTGDLGALYRGELYVTGRIKDVIIIRGQNHYPQDIELTVSRAHPALCVGHGAAFSISVGQEERLVVVQEVKRSQRKKFDGAEVVRTLRTVIAEQHGLAVHAIALLNPASVHITSSGKIQRKACKQDFLDRRFDVLYAWQEGQALAAEAIAPVAPNRRGERYSHIADWLVQQIAQRQHLPLTAVMLDMPFHSLGFDSAGLIALSGALSTWLGRPVEPTLMYDYPSVERLAYHLAGLSQQRNTVGVSTGNDALAIVGMACRFPGADSVAAYWQLLAEARDAIDEVPPARWPAAQFYQAGAVAAGKMNTRWGGFVTGIDEFDAAFFGVSPREAQSMDPQQRLLLQTTWHALEDAGIPPDTLAGSRTGVFVGISSNDYRQLQLVSHVGADAYSGTGNAASIAANRISYVLDLCGPSVAVDTACSSSLVALHQARLSLQAGECDLAIVAGVNLILAPDTTLVFSQANMMAADGRCKTFDARADGYVRSEGCGVVILKRLAPGQRDGERILALIAGSAVNQDGRSNGLTAPNGVAQQAVLRQALASARLPASRVTYVEAHGTGTRLGDPIEIAALKAVYGVTTAAESTLWIGAVKSNIGHLEPAAGIAGLIKVVLAMQHGQIPANLHLQQINPAISLDGTRCALPVTMQAWQDAGQARVAAVSAFSFGGTNAHVILQQAPAADRPSGAVPAADDATDLLLLSAKSPPALRKLAADYADLLADTNASLRQICTAAAQQRSHHALRLALPCAVRADAIGQLRRYSQGELPAAVLHGAASAPGKVAFLFTGQGAQYAGMGRGLYEDHAVCRASLDRCAAILATQMPRPLLEVLFSDDGAALMQTEYAQPVLFALEYALASVWLSSGVQPDYLIGHSLGEYVAACLAGVFSLEDALMLVAQRGRLMQHGAAPGAMLAVRADAAEIQRFLQSADFAGMEMVALAAHNSPQDIVLSGEQAALQSLLPYWAARQATSTWLAVTRAFHSPLMHSMLADFAQVTRQVHYSAPSIPVISNLTGKLAGAEIASADYWLRHVLQPVLFGEGLATLAAAGCRTYVEVGPHPVLTAFGKQIVADALWLPTLRRGQDDVPHWLHSLGLWHVAGGEVDWRQLGHDRSGGTPLATVALPLYPFQQDRYWFTPRVATPGVGTPGAPAVHSQWHPLLGEALDIAGASACHFRNTLTQQQPAFIAQHRVFGAAVLPAAAILEWALAALAQANREAASGWLLRHVEFRRAMTLGEATGVTVQLALQADGVLRRIRCYGRDAQSSDAGWQEHAVLDAAPITDHDAIAPVALDILRNTLTPQTVNGCYEEWRSRGMDYGPTFQGLRGLWRDATQALGYIEVADLEPSVYHLNPMALDACLHTLIAFSGELPGREVLLPVGLSQLRCLGSLPARLWCHAVWHGEQAPGRYAASLTVCDDSGAVLAVLDDLQLLSVSRDRLGIAEPAAMPDSYATVWLPMADDTPVTEAQGRWLVYCPDAAQARALHAASATLGQRRLIVTAAAGFQRLEPGLIGVCPQSEADIAKLFASLLEEQTAPQGLLLLQGGNRCLADEVVECTYLTTQAGFLFSKAFLTAYADTAPDIIVCVQGEGHGCAWLASSVLAGLTKSVIAEYPQIKCVQVDIASDRESDRQSLDLTQVLAAAARLAGAGHIALRDGRWFRAELQALKLDAVPANKIRSDASYLISGGLGGLGGTVAEWLVEHGARSLVLIGRSLPANRIAWLDSLQGCGVRVEILQVDIGDPQAWQAVASQLDNYQPPLRGIVHAAGVLDDGVMAQLDWPRLHKVLAPKVGGAWHLHRLSEQLDLDFFALFSSITSLIGAAGQCNYVMANAFLDGLAHYRQQLGLPISCINWGPWSETGMATQPQTMARLARIGMQGMESRHALQAFAAALQTRTPQIGVARIDWPRYLAAMPRRHPHLLLSAVAEDGEAQVMPPQAGSDFMGAASLGSREAIADYLLDKAARVLRLDAQRQSSLRTDFPQLHLNRLGLDSLMAIELRNRILADLAIDVPIHYLIGTYVVSDLVDLIDAQLAVQRVLQGEGEADMDDAEREVCVL